MIRAEELMTGDYIFRPDCYDKVVEIRSNGIIGTDRLRGLIPFSQLEPISVTQEILEKIGFYFGYTSSMEDSINNIASDFPFEMPEKTWCYDDGDIEITIDFPTESDGWDGRSISTGKVEHYTPKTYGKGGWNIPDVKYWLDCNLPNIEE